MAAALILVMTVSIGVAARRRPSSEPNCDAWGLGVHSHDMGGAMLPEMMRWLWRDHPVSIDPHDTVERSFRK